MAGNISFANSNLLVRKVLISFPGVCYKIILHVRGGQESSAFHIKFISSVSVHFFGTKLA